MRFAAAAEASLAGKWLELLRDADPGFSRIALLFNPRTAPGGGAFYLRPTDAAAILARADEVIE